MSKLEEQPCEFPACAVHHICESPCKRNRTETLAKALADMADVDFDNVFLRAAAHLRALDASHQRLLEALQEIAENDPYKLSSAGLIARTAIEQARALT